MEIGAPIDDQLPHQRPVDTPDAAQHAVFFEWPAIGGEPEGRQKHAETDDGGGKAGAEQLEPRQPKAAMDQQPDQ